MSKGTIAARVDRLPRQIDPSAFYVNIDATKPPHDPADAPDGKPVVIVYDGANDLEVIELAGRCWDLDYTILVLGHESLAHIDRDRDDVMMGLGRAGAYRRESNRWCPTPKLVRAICRHVCDDPGAKVAVDGAA